MRPFSDFRRISRRWQLLTAAALLAAGGAAHAQNAAVYSWNPPGSVRSEDVRIRPIGSVLPDYFDLGVPEVVSPLKSQSFIYVRFRNNHATTVIPEGAVTVTAEYAEAAPGLDPATLPAAAAAVAAWQGFGNYVMDLEFPVNPPPGYGLLPGGTTYPTVFEVGLPSRYRIACSVSCAQPLPTAFFLRVTLAFGADTDGADNVAYSYYDLTGGLPPADVVILHDVSGSMLAELPVAKERAKMFVDLMNQGDRVGVVAFSTQFFPGNTQIAASLNPIASIDPTDPGKTFAKAGIDSFTASGATPMGAGVLQAKAVLNAALPPYPPNRAIVMLTDGMENVDPRLQAPGYPILEGLNDDANGPIALFPLWFGEMSNWGTSLLQDVADHVDRGKLVEQPSDDLKLAEAYLMIRGILTSDDVYDIHRGIAGDGYEAAIDVDTVTDELIFTVAWRTFERELDVAVLPPGAQSWQSAGALATSTSRGQLYAIHRFRDPAAGPWRYRLTRSPQGEPYVLAALADKVDILMQSNLSKGSLAAGEPLVINARLSRGGRPVPGARVRATVEAPSRSLGTLLNQMRGQLKTPVQVDPTAEPPRAAGILAELRDILGSDPLFPFGSGTVELTDEDGDGTYTGRFTDTRVAGTYRVAIVAESPENDGFRREHRHAAVVSLGDIDGGRSVVDVVLLPRVSRDVTLRAVTIIPVDVHGNFVDPGYGSRIQVDSTAGRWIGDLIDNQDGSYTRILQLAPGEEGTIRVTAFGDRLPERGTDGGAVAGGKRELSFHAGLVEPTGSFDRLVDRGPSFTLDLGYHLRPRLTALLLLGAHDFPLQAGGGSESVRQVSGNLRWRLSPNPFSGYVQGGAGAYRVFGGWEAGINFGFGLTYPASPSADLFWGVDYHDVLLSGDDAEFWQLHIGYAIDF